MGRGNKTIDKLMVKTIFEDNILIPLPKVFFENRLFPLFTIISPTRCDFCDTKLKVNSHYDSVPKSSDKSNVTSLHKIYNFSIL
jgi:hypothetical protein